MVVFKTSETIYETNFVIKPPSEKGRNITLR